MKAVSALIVLACASSASAQTIMDESGKSLPQAELKAAITLLSAQFTDPYGVQIRKVRRQGPGFCGEINVKNDRGGYVGFAPFYVSTNPRTILFVPAIASLRDQYAEKVTQLCG